MISREEVLELYVIELQPKCWSICSTLSETKMIDTPRTLCFGSAEVYRNEAIAGRHCNNIINGGKFVNAKVVSLHFNQEPTLDSNVEEAIELVSGLQMFELCNVEIGRLKKINQALNTIKQVIRIDCYY